MADKINIEEIDRILNSTEVTFVQNIVNYTGFDINSTINLLVKINNTKSYIPTFDDRNIGILLKNMIINYIHTGENIDIEPIQLTGGFSDDVWPIFSKIYDVNTKLEFRQKGNPNLVFSVIKHENNPYTPLLGKGTYTAVYEVQKIEEGIKKENYILRFTTNPKPHFLDNIKIKTEYLNFGSFLPKRYYYGYCNFNDKNMKHVSDDNYIPDVRNKNYNFEYFITKKYRPFNWSKNITGKYIGFNISNTQKFDLLINIVKLLKTFYDKNIIHTDLKIDNISFDEDLIPICIDYDKETLQEVSLKNSKLIINRNILSHFWFATTYFPNYFKQNISTFSYKNYIIKPQHYLNLKLYSIGGLTEIIRRLEIDFIIDQIDIPIDVYNYSISGKKLSQSIYLDNPNNFIQSLHLEYGDHTKILDYNEILIVLDYIKRQGYVKK